MLSGEFGYTRTETGKREQKWGFYPRVSRFKTHFFLLQCMTQFYVRESAVFFVGQYRLLKCLNVERIQFPRITLHFEKYILIKNVLFFCYFPGPPSVSPGFLDRYVAQEGDTVRLACPIRGNPRPIVEWYQVRNKEKIVALT